MMELHGDGYEEDGDALIRLSPSGGGFRYPASYLNNLSAIARAPDGAAWYNDGGDYLKRVTDAGTQTNFPLAPPNSSTQEVSSIAFAADGTPWFTEYWPGGLFGSGACCGQIGWVSGGSGHLIPIGSQETGQGLLPHSMVRGPDGALWFAFGGGYSNGYDGIGRVDPASGGVQFGNLAPYVATDIAFGADGALWLIDQGANRVGRIGDPASLLTTPGSPPPRPPSSPPPAPPPPKLHGKAPPAKLRAAKKALRVRAIEKRRAIVLSCALTGAGKCSVRLAIKAKDARRLHLKVGKKAKSVVIGKASKQLGRAGKAMLKVKLAAKVLRALRHLHGPLRVSAAVTSSAPGTTSRHTVKRLKVRP